MSRVVCTTSALLGKLAIEVIRKYLFALYGFLTKYCVAFFALSHSRPYVSSCLSSMGCQFCISRCRALSYLSLRPLAYCCHALDFHCRCCRLFFTLSVLGQSFLPHTPSSLPPTLPPVGGRHSVRPYFMNASHPFPFWRMVVFCCVVEFVSPRQGGVFSFTVSNSCVGNLAQSISSALIRPLCDASNQKPPIRHCDGRIFCYIHF